MNDSYFISNHNKKDGPYSLDELKKKQITERTLVWKNGQKDWIPANKLSELQNIFENTPPPLPNDKSTVSSKEILKRLVIATVFAIVVKFISFDLVMENFGGSENMSPRNYSDTRMMSYFFAVVGFILVLIIFYFTSKNRE